MRTDDIIALAIFTTAGVAAYLLYTKQIEWPFGDIPNPFEETKSDDKEEQDVVKDIAGETDFSAKDFITDALKKGEDILSKPYSKSNFNPKDIIGNAFDLGKDILKAPANFLEDALKTGQDILKPKSIVDPTIIPKNRYFKKPFLYTDYKGGGEGEESCEGIERYCDQVRLFKAQLPPKYRHCKCN